MPQDSDAWQRAYDESLARERERLQEATGGPGGCLSDFASEVVGGFAICAAFAALFLAFRAFPYWTTLFVTLALSVLYSVQWRAAKRRGDSRPRYAAAGAVLIALLISLFVWLTYCACW